MDPELIEPKGGGLFLTRDELTAICTTFNLFIVWDNDDVPTLHYERVDRSFRCSARMGHKFGGWIASHGGHRHDVELRMALGLSERPLAPLRKSVV